jgi:DNA-binding LacI/PurR family transcriptional regulator
MKELSNRPVCLQDIADRANVSRATVSLALRNHASIPVHTRARIQQVAAVLEYRPNPMVSALMTYQRIARPARRNHVTLALLLPHSRSGDWRPCVPPALIEAASARAQHHGYRLEEFWLDDLKLDSNRLNEVLYARGIPGILLAPSPASAVNVEVEWDRFSAVEIGTSRSGERPHRVAANHFEAVRDACRRLSSRGYERPGLVLKASQDALTDGLWNAGFLFEQQRWRARKRIAPLVVSDPYWCRTTFLKWFESRRPDVVLGCGEEIRGWLESAGARLPEDVGFAQLDIRDVGGGHAGVDANAPALGSAAVDFLVDLLRRNERGLPPSPRSVLLETAWIEGATVRARPGAEPPFSHGADARPWPPGVSSAVRDGEDGECLPPMARVA